MDIPSDIRRYHARYHSRPYPCGYCFNYCGNADSTITKANLVMSFVQDERCNGGLLRPTGYGECERFYPTALEHRRHCIPELFELLQREYLMYVISRVYELPGITMTDAVARSHRGYNARRERIDELIELGYIEQLEDIHNNKVLYCTALGDRLALAVRQMYDNIILVFQEDDIMHDADIRRIFDYIRHNRWCSAFDIYSICDNGGIILEDTDAYVAIQELLDAGYIIAEFDTNDWETIRYDTTERGIRAYDKDIEMQ